MNKRMSASLIIALLIMSVGQLSIGASQPPRKLDAGAYQDTWRRLWEEHITWMRMVIVGTLDDLKDADMARTRLFQNPADIEAALKLVLGPADPGAVRLAGLLREHLIKSARILEAIRTHHDPVEALEAWYANGEKIAVQMNAMNPDLWPLESAKMMWRDHLEATAEQIWARHPLDPNDHPNYVADIAAFDKVQFVSLNMADFFSQGLIQGFPQKFSGGADLGRGLRGR